MTGLLSLEQDPIQNIMDPGHCFKWAETINGLNMIIAILLGEEKIVKLLN
jgi:hypothetical protein